MYDKEAVGLRIKALRKALFMTQDDLAEKAGYSGRSSIAKIETGKTDIPGEKLKVLADILQTNVFFLQTGQDLSDYAFDPEAYAESQLMRGTLSGKILDELDGLSDVGLEKVLEFAKYLKYQENRATEEAL